MPHELGMQGFGQWVAKLYQEFGEPQLDAIARTTGRPHQRAGFYVTLGLGLGPIIWKLMGKRLPQPGFLIPFSIHNTTRLIDYLKEYQGFPVGAAILGPTEQAPVFVTPPAAGVTGGLF